MIWQVPVPNASKCRDEMALEYTGARGVDVRILLPGYRSVVSMLRTRTVGKPFKPLTSADRVRLLRAELPGRGIPIYLIDSPALYDRPGGPYTDPYGKDWWDNAIRFGMLSKVGALFGSGLLLSLHVAAVVVLTHVRTVVVRPFEDHRLSAEVVFPIKGGGRLEWYQTEKARDEIAAGVFESLAPENIAGEVAYLATASKSR